METAGSLRPLPDHLRDIRAARAGSPEALGRLLEGSRRYLLSVANQELDSQLLQKAGASDLVQDTFLEAQRIFARFQGDSEEDLLAWLRVILRNKLATHSRKFLATAKRQVAREVTGAGRDTSCAETDEASPSEVFARDEQAQALRAALTRLPEHYRRIIHCRQWENLSFEEIAGRFGCSADAARMLWWRAIERLQKEYPPARFP